MPPITIHPDNPKLFLFRGAPRVLVTATEHYGAVMNRPFRFARYLADAAERGITCTRLFVLFREMQSVLNPYSTCKPESLDYIAPYPRTGPGTALDGQPRFDLSGWNPEFFDRLERFLTLASEYGIIVEITLLSNTYGDGVWALQALHPANNLDGWTDIPWADYMSTRHPALFARQVAHVRKIVECTRRFDNVIYEICNEPGGEAYHGAPTLAEVNAWQEALAREVRAVDDTHLIAGQEAFAYRLPDESRRSGPDVFQFADASFTMPFDVVNMHPLSNMVYRGAHYNLGPFMQGELRLRELRDYCLALYPERKPLNLDEDNAASQYKDLRGWTIHRKRAWTALFCGAHYDVIDFSIINYCERGTPASRRGLRAWIGRLAQFMHTFDLAHARPAPEVLVSEPPHTVGAVLAAGADRFLYLADASEWGTPGCGAPIRCTVTLDLPAGAYDVSYLAPATGKETPGASVDDGAATVLPLPAFRQDLVVTLRRR